MKKAGVSSEAQTSQHDIVRLSLEKSGVKDNYPDVANMVIRWYDQGCDPYDLATLKHNGAGKQVVLLYQANVFADILKFCVTLQSKHRSMTPDDKIHAGRVLMGTCLFNNNMIADIFSMSTATITTWKLKRPDNFPMKRLGGMLGVDAVPLILSWWEQRINEPGKKNTGWLLTRASQEGATWPAIARLIGMTVQDAKKAASDEKGTPVNVNITIETNDRSSSATTSKISSEGHHSRSSVSSAEQYSADKPGESLISAPIPVTEDNDAFAPAVYLASDDEANDINAGLSDTPEDGVHTGSEGNLREGTEGSERGTHPFFLA